MDLLKLREIRRKKKISLETLEQHLKVSREIIGKYEKGKASPRLCLLLDWCKYLDVKIGFIDV
jgi:transcriptional regulator with XRE-family HTH domain